MSLFDFVECECVRNPNVCRSNPEFDERIWKTTGTQKGKPEN